MVIKQATTVDISSSPSASCRAKHEIEHGRRLAQGDTERIWGWGTPAGQVRARRRAELIAAGARLGPGIYALEIGCGTGLFTEMFARTGATLVAVDISPDLLERAQRRGLPAGQVLFLAKRFEECEVEGPF
ncbi:MAG: methyltransferase domain-containing protein, partial [Anaerolineae bacterium]|nr:methyltransferase domain-containing protein [Anaerolineae bacterium]